MLFKPSFETISCNEGSGTNATATAGCPGKCMVSAFFPINSMFQANCGLKNLISKTKILQKKTTADVASNSATLSYSCSPSTTCTPSAFVCTSGSCSGMAYSCCSTDNCNTVATSSSTSISCNVGTGASTAQVAGCSTQCLVI